jgi:hypothetical protein
MKRCLLIFLLPAVASAGNDDYYLSATAAARELSRQLDYLQRAIATIPGPNEGRGFYDQLNGIYLDMVFFQQQLKRKVPREMLVIAFDRMDGKLHNLLDNLRNFEKWTPALQTVDARVRAADHDLHFALLGGGSSGDQSAVLQRQTLVLLARMENLENMVRYVYAGRPPLDPWLADLAGARQAIKKFQELQASKTETALLTEQFSVADRAWQKVVDRVNAMPANQDLIIRSDAAQADQTFARLAQALGIDNRRAPLSDPLAF